MVGGQHEQGIATRNALSLLTCLVTTVAALGG
jgi:hypothetical protein